LEPVFTAALKGSICICVAQRKHSAVLCFNWELLLPQRAGASPVDVEGKQPRGH